MFPCRSPGPRTQVPPFPITLDANFFSFFFLGLDQVSAICEGLEPKNAPTAIV